MAMLYLAMHIPDGFLSSSLVLVGWMLVVVLMAVALRITHAQLGERQVPVMGVLTAFIFAAQAINFPVAAGTSGHLCGAALAAIVLGPWAAALVMASVVTVQALLFQDGGLLVLPFNIINMGFLAPGAAWATYATLARLRLASPAWRRIATFAAAWVSIVAAASATALELAVSQTSPLALALPAMLGVHALIGLGEALITCGAVSLLEAGRPQVLQQAESAPGRLAASLTTLGLFGALVVAACAPLASTSPDGLEAVAGQLGFAGLARETGFSLLQGLRMAGAADPNIALAVATVLGTLAAFGFSLFLGRLLRRRVPSG